MTKSLRVTVLVTCSTLLTVLGGQLPGLAAPPAQHPAPPTDPGPAVHGVYPLSPRFAKPVDHIDGPYRPRPTVWPAAATDTLSVSAPEPGAGQGPRVKGSHTPIWVQALAGDGGSRGPAQASVRMLDRAVTAAAGVTGVVFTVSPQTGAGSAGAYTLRIGVDYSGFAQAYGGNYAVRLRLVQLPACALTTPEVPACRRGTPLPSRNDLANQTVSAPVTADGTVVLAATSDPGQEGGAGGSYAATTLKPSGSWTAGSSTGSFTYSYPVTVPPAVSGLVPQVTFTYDSGSVDGQTATTQAQSSWVGDGWSTPRSFIEQSFIPCSDNPQGTASPVSTSDQCYNGQILTLSLNGRSTALVWDSAKSVWKAVSDNGEVITHVTNSNNGTGTYNTDYWKVVDRNGTAYLFGRNQLPGWSAGQATTNSVDSVPVYSAHPGNPCYNASWSSSWCTMAYRWNLDYVTDIHGNAMSYYYKQDSNFYGRNKGAVNTSYIRDSHLDHIDYGFTDGNAYGTVPNKVLFVAGDRCLSGTCNPLNSSTKANWPDVPYDLICAAGTTCSSWGPSFFSTVRLTAITTQQYSTISSRYENVDSYALSQIFPSNTGDGLSPTLWLESITRTGYDTTAGGSTSPITLPPVQFTATLPMANRVDTGPDGLPALNRYRIQAVTTESGSVISAFYGQPDPCTAPVTIAPETNTSSCYPVYWTPSGYTQPYRDWFNKYVVTRVTQTDPTGGAPPTQTDYIYAGGAGWHFDDNEVVQPKYRSYGQFRGYGTVKTLTGNGNPDPQTLSETRFYRGMSKNNNSTIVNLTDSQGGVHEDVNQLAGQPLEKISYLGNGGPVDHSTITSYWVSDATATRNRTGLSPLTAHWVAPAQTWTRQAVTTGGTTTWRYTQTDISYNADTADVLFGTVQHTYSHTVPVNAAYDQCTSTSYAPVNTAANLVGLVAEVETVSVACGGFTQGSPASVPAALNTLTAPANVNRPAQVVSKTRTFYDDPTFSSTFPQTSAPSRGNVTMVLKAKDYQNNAWVWPTTATKRFSYDTYGRITGVWDGNGNRTATGYTMNAVGLTTTITVTNALNQATSTTLDPQRALTLTSTDLNGVVTTTRYDALGRTTAVWLASRPTTAPANYTYSYLLQNNGVTAVITKKMNDGTGYITSTLIYDALLRTRQTQSDTPQSGRLVTDTFYDSRGWTAATYNGWWDPATLPNTTLVSAANLHASVPNQHFYTYDGLGRTVIDVSAKDGQEQTRTTTVYNGDRTTTIAPTGAVTQTTITDPLGRTIERDQYTTAPTLRTPPDTFTGLWYVSGGSVTATTYGYDGHGNQNQVTETTGGAGGAQATWTSTYNLLGHVISKTDPDAGTIAIQYDGNGNLIESTDSRTNTISYRYDALNRKTGLYAAPASSQSSDNQLASWVYDNSNNAITGMKYPLGQLTTATAYWDGAAYTIQQKNFNVFGKSLGQIITIPAGEGLLAGTYTFNHVYSANTGLLLKDTYPNNGGLPGETVNHGYDAGLDLPQSLGGLSGYANATLYDAYWRITQETLGAAPNQAYLTNQWNPHTGQLKNQLLTRSTATPTNVDEQAYDYDDAGNIIRQTSTRLGAATPTETQCYTYDNLARLTAAWTATDACATTPTSSSHDTVGDSLGATSAYWTTWTFDPLGQRTQQVQHAFTGGPSTDNTTTYTYNNAGTNQPHTLTGTTSSTSPATSYSYDTAGNLTTRNAAQGNQTLAWNDAGRLTSITTSGKGTSSFKYDADGNLLIQSDPGATTLYLPGQQITVNTSTNTLTGVRYYPLPGGGTAIRTGTGNAYQFTITDQHNTPVLYLDNTAQIPTWRQYTPYGDTRGTTNTWPDNRSFLNQPHNTVSGLTHLGAREYDPTLGRFISIDPIIDMSDPQQHNGYTYAHNNPATFSDPSGLKDEEETGHYKWVHPEEHFTLPDGVSSQAVYKNGVWQRQIYGQTVISGYVLPKGAPDVDRLAAEVDAALPWFYKQYGRKVRGLTAHDVNIILRNICDSDRKFCGKEFVKNLVSDHFAFISDLALNDLDKLGGAPSLWRGGARGATGCGNSFMPGTPVLMADGSSKLIEQIHVGDRVLATDPQTGQTQAKTVMATIIGNGSKDLVEITVDIDGKQGEAVGVLTATGGHPFWLPELDVWVDAADLKAGQWLQTSAGTWLQITAIKHRTQSATVYNLTIADIHTYYVLAGNTPVLVHNTGPGGCWRAGDATDIARGHADGKHGREFPGMSAADLEAHVGDVMRNPLRTKNLNNNRKAFLGRDGQTIVIHDPMHPDGGTVFRRTTGLDDYWDGLS